MSQQSDQKLNEFSVQLLPVDESRFEKKPIQQIPTTHCGLLWYKPVAVPVFSTCIIVAVVVAASILILQNYTSTFKPSWREWHYINDFQLSQVYTMKNGTRIDYTNRSELNNTIFNPDNQKGIKMYDYWQAIIQLNTEDTLDEIKVTLKVAETNEYFTEDLAVATTTEFIL